MELKGLRNKFHRKRSQQNRSNENKFSFTMAVALMILDPPEAPATILTSPFLSVTIVGDIDERGRFPG